MEKSIVFILLMIFCQLFSVISDLELQTLESMLQEMDLTLESLNFPKDWATTEFKIPKMIEILEKPLQYPIFVEELKNRLLERDFVGFYDFAMNTVFEGKLEDNEFLIEMYFVDVDSVRNISLYDMFISNCENRLWNIQSEDDILSYVEYVFEVSNDFWVDAFRDLEENEIKLLEVFLLSLAQAGDESNEKYSSLFENMIKPDDEWEIEDYIELIKKIDFTALTTSAKYFFTGMELLRPRDLSHLSYTRQTVLHSKFGQMVVGTRADDVYNAPIPRRRTRRQEHSMTQNIVFIYDPAGNDTYSFDISTNINKPFLAIIDVSGDDVYRNSQIGKLFNASFGSLYHYDGEGNDYYYGDDLAFSANIGSLLSIDGAGNDTYLVGSKSLGAATFGVALVINAGGNNTFSGTCMTQGFGGTLGLGLLASYDAPILYPQFPVPHPIMPYAVDNFDEAIFDSINTFEQRQAPLLPHKNDTYISGGRYKHGPLVPDDYRSMSQGFGFGIRPDMAGGIGILFDEAGNDQYIGAVYAQGGAYWYALGILIDLAGNDVYRAVYYPQGSGIHLAAGFLYDENGDDSYYSRFGPGQGAGHDYGVGFLVDKDGNDHYSIDGGNGMGITNSVGIFIDSAGNDRYERKRQDSYGFANISRNSGGIGIFLDMCGDDLYPNDNMMDNSSWINGIFGMGKDMEYTLITPNVVPKLASELAEGEEGGIEEQNDDSFSTFLSEKATIQELFSIASGWEVGSAVAEIQEARRVMLHREIETADYIYDKKLMTKSGLELRAILDLARNSEYIWQKLSNGVNHEHFRAVGNTIYMIGELADTSFLDLFENMLDEDRNVGSILSALGNIKTERSIDLLERFMDTDNIYRRVTIARSLLALNSERSLELLMTYNDVDCFLIKTMIYQLIPNTEN
ncbi:MAG: hypothetical protein FWG98_12040 [Candidatus Cloacimonetes bacterium]|nr:hypothetical protein [Candidatus Cloacimonadota bacterium]